MQSRARTTMSVLLQTQEVMVIDSPNYGYNAAYLET